jgi:hypothetical protein
MQVSIAVIAAQRMWRKVEHGAALYPASRCHHSELAPCEPRAECGTLSLDVAIKNQRVRHPPRASTIVGRTL